MDVWAKAGWGTWWAASRASIASRKSKSSQQGPVRRIAILCGLCTVLTGAAASGAPLSSSSARSTLSQASPTGLVAARLPRNPNLAHSSREQVLAQDGAAKRTDGSAAAQVILLGTQTIEPSVRRNSAGTAEAFAFRARRTGTAASISVFLDARDRARTVIAGLYSNQHGHPHSLLASGRLRAPKARAWNTVPVSPAKLRSGTTYWLAVLGKGGPIYFRDRNARLCTGKHSSEHNGRSLPKTWPAGPNSHACQISAYIKGKRRNKDTNNPTRTTAIPPTSTTPGNAPVNAVQPYFVASIVSSTTGACTAGCAIEGQQLSVIPGVWSNGPTFSYRWQDCTTTAGTNTGVAVTTGGASNIMNPPTTGSCSNISGATSSSYRIQPSDVGKALAVNVTATNGHGSATTTPTGSCNTGLMTTTWNASTDMHNPGPASTYFDNGQPGCSPISAVVGTGQYGTSTNGEHFCTNAPTTCGFADIANAGVPPGTSLYAVPGTCTSPAGPGTGCANTGSGWSYSGGRITMSSNSVLQNVSFAAGMNTTSVISISGTTANVTIQDSDISSGCNCNYQAAGGLINVAGSGGSITIENNNLHGIDASTAGDGCNAAVYGGSSTGANITVANNNIYFCATGLNQVKGTTAGWTIDDNYIHDFAWADSAKSNHMDGIQFEDGGNANSPTDFVNNTDLLDMQQTDAVILSTDNNLAESYRWIAHNLLAGGDIALYLGGSATYVTTNSTFENNVFSQIYMGDHNTMTGFGSGTYGPTAYWTASTNTWSNGIWDDNGAAIAPDTCNNTPGHYCP